MMVSERSARREAAFIFRGPGITKSLPPRFISEIQMSKLGNIGTHIGARRKISLALMAAFGTLSLGAHAEGAHTRHVHAEIQGGEAQMVGTPSASQVMRLDIVLPVRDREGQ